MIRIPYGISNFKTLATEGYHYVDRTEYITLLESLGEKYISFSTPTAFWQKPVCFHSSALLWLATQAGLSMIYLKQSIVGQQPTPLANTYMTLVFRL